METKPWRLFRKNPLSAFMDSLTIPRSKQQNEVAEVKHERPQSSLVESLNWGEEQPVHPVFSRTQNALVRTIGQRMREARELCNMGQQVAAKALGYSNSSELAKIEGAIDINSVPLVVIQRAARLYDVSSDFLFGLTSDWERDGGGLEDRETFGYLLAMREKDLRSFEANFARLARQVRVVADVVAGLESSIEVLQRGVSRAVESPAFCDVPGGAAILSSARRIAGSFGAARLAFKKSKLDVDAWTNDLSRGLPSALHELAGMEEKYRRVAIRVAAIVYDIPLSTMHEAVKELVSQSARCPTDDPGAIA